MKAMRGLAVDAGIHQPGWQEWNRLTDERRHEPVLNGTPVDQAHVADWADGLGLPVGGETVLFCDCEAAFHRTSMPRALARILAAAGVEFGLMREQWCCGGPGRDGLRGAGAALRRAQRRRLARERHQPDHRHRPARLHLLHRGLPRFFGDDLDFEFVLAVELVAELVRDGAWR